MSTRHEINGAKSCLCGGKPEYYLHHSYPEMGGGSSEVFVVKCSKCGLSNSVTELYWGIDLNTILVPKWNKFIDQLTGRNG